MSAQSNVVPPPASAISVPAHQVPIVPFAPPIPQGMREAFAETLAPRFCCASDTRGKIQWASWAQAMTALVTVGGVSAAIVNWWAWFAEYAVCILGSALIVTGGAFCLFVQGVRKSNKSLSAAVETDRQKLANTIQAQMVQKFQQAVSAEEQKNYDFRVDEEQRIMALWTPDAVMQRVDFMLDSAIFTPDDSPECALLLRWRLASIIGIPHEIKFLGGKCEVHSLASVGAPIVYLNLCQLPTIALDGKLTPEELSLIFVDDRALIDASLQTTMRAAFKHSEAIRLKIMMRCSVFTNGNSSSMNVIVRSHLVEIPAWIKQHD